MMAGKNYRISGHETFPCHYTWLPKAVRGMGRKFLHTYVPTRGRKGEIQEDNLDCPLVELELIVKGGERELDRAEGKREPMFQQRLASLLLGALNIEQAKFLNAEDLDLSASS